MNARILPANDNRIDNALDTLDAHFIQRQVMPFNFGGKSIRVATDERGEPLFVGKDICEALGYTNPNKAMGDHCKGITKRYPLQTAGGMQELRVISEPDVMRLVVSSTLPAAEAFERLVFEEILPTIRKTGSYNAVRAQAPTLNRDAEAFKLLPLAIRAARALGLDRNVASISANQAVFKITGTNVLSLMDHTHLKAEDQTPYLTPTELGKLVGVSPRALNVMLAGAGLQGNASGRWMPTAQAEGLYRTLDTGKRHGDGAMVQQIKWSPQVLAILQPVANTMAC